MNQAVKLLYLMQSQLKLVDSNMNFTDEVCNSIQFGKHFIKAHVDHLDVLCYELKQINHHFMLYLRYLRFLHIVYRMK